MRAIFTFAVITATISLSSYAESRIDPYREVDSRETNARCLRAFMNEPKSSSDVYDEGFCEGIAHGAVTALGVMVEEFHIIESKRKTKSKEVQCLEKELRNMGRNPRIALTDALSFDRGKDDAIPMMAAYSAMKNRLSRLCGLK